MKTIEIYENIETSVLKSLLKQFETALDNIDILIDISKNKGEDCENLDKISRDYQIDVSLIRMELTKRFWYDLEIFKK